MAKTISNMFFIYLMLFTILLPNIAQSKLIGVIQVIRHGARTPINYYQDVIDKYAPFHASELTNQGFSMAYEKGKSTRDYFTKHGLYSQLSPESVEVVSTPYERTIFTAMSYMKGMFPEYNIRYSGVKDESLSALMKERNSFFLKNTNSFINDKKVMVEKVERRKLVPFLRTKQVFNNTKKLNSTNTMNDNPPIDFDMEYESFIQNLQTDKEINIEVIGHNKRYLYYHKCVNYNRHKVKSFHDLKLSDKNFKLVLSLRAKYPKMFEEYCKNQHKKKSKKTRRQQVHKNIATKKNHTARNQTKVKAQSVMIEMKVNNLDKDTCPDEMYRSTKFIKDMASTLETINYHLEPVDPQILKLAYIEDFRYNYAKFNSYMNKQSASALFRYFYAFLKNSGDCKKSKMNYSNLKNYKQEFEYMENKFKCKKYALISAHDDTIQTIIRNLFNIEKDTKEILKNSDNKSFKDLEEKLKFYWPTYITDFTFELHEVDKKKFMKIFMNGKELNNMDFITKRYSIKPNYTKDGYEYQEFLYYLENRIDATTKYHIPCTHS